MTLKLKRKAEEPADNAAIEGDDVAPSANIPVALDTVYDRLDRALRMREAALLCLMQPRASALETQRYWVYECELQDGGKVRRIDLVARARELGVLEDFETPLDHWYQRPPH